MHKVIIKTVKSPKVLNHKRCYKKIAFLRFHAIYLTLRRLWILQQRQRM